MLALANWLAMSNAVQRTPSFSMPRRELSRHHESGSQAPTELAERQHGDALESERKTHLAKSEAHDCRSAKDNLRRHLVGRDGDGRIGHAARVGRTE